MKERRSAFIILTGRPGKKAVAIELKKFLNLFWYFLMI